MGLQCVKIERRDQEAIKLSQDRLYQREMSRIKEPVAFNIKVSNLRILNFPKAVTLLKFSMPEYFDIQIPISDFINQNNVFLNKGSYFADIKQPLGAIITKNVQISITREGKEVEVLKMKFLNLLKGPVHHDHLLMQFDSRLLFDLHIDQILQADILLNNLQIKWKKHEQVRELSYTLSLIVSFYLQQFLSNYQFPFQSHKKFQKHEKIKFLAINQCLIRSSQLLDGIIKLKIANQEQKDQNFELFIPFTKFQEKTSTSKTAIIDNMTYQIREISLEQNLISKGQIIGSIQLEFKCFTSKLYTQQMELMIFSQNGIVVTTPTKIGPHHQKNKALKYQTLQVFLKKLIDFKNNGTSQYIFYLFLESILAKLDEKVIIITDDILKIQEILLQLLYTLVYFLQADKQMQNEYIWNIINQICHQNIFSLKYFCSISNEELKIELGIKFYKFIIFAMKKIIAFTKNGIYHKECMLIHRFIAYVYFKFPWCQNQIINSLKRPNDPIITEQKLGEIGASYSLKSPSKNYFYDWETSLYRKIKKNQIIIRQLQSLQQTKKANEKWAKLLFDRDYNELFFSLYSMLWDQAEMSLNNNGKIMWQYFPKYGDLLSFFIGQMNNNKLMDYSNEMTKCNIKMIKNEKLLNTFMMLIFPKTHLYETYCVLKCLDLIECYFEVILKHNKKLPYEFHYNYFYTGVRCIFESNHLFLLQKMLVIIYRYYKIFSHEFIQTLNHFILKKVFYDLFLHWSHQVRNIFHFLLIFRIISSEQGENPQKSKNIDMQEKNSQYYEIFQTLHELTYRKQKQEKLKCSIGQEYVKGMKAKLKQKIKARKQAQKELDDYALKEYIHHKHSYNEDESENMCETKTKAYHIEPNMRRKWSLNMQFDHSHIHINQKELCYLQTSLKEYQHAKKQKNPDLKIEMRRKMFDFNNEE